MVTRFPVWHNVGRTLRTLPWNARNAAQYACRKMIRLMFRITVTVTRQLCQGTTIQVTTHFLRAVGTPHEILGESIATSADIWILWMKRLGFDVLTAVQFVTQTWTPTGGRASASAKRVLLGLEYANKILQLCCQLSHVTPGIVLVVSLVREVNDNVREEMWSKM